MRIAFLVAVVTLLSLTQSAHAESAKENVLWSFCGIDCPDGQYPQGALVFDAAGNLYGATTDGGTGLGGTIFELSRTSKSGWGFSVIYSFQFGTSDGDFPNGSLIFDESGNLYGTTRKGGTYGRGTVFELSRTGGSGGDWMETILYNFGGFMGDGQYPGAGLVRDQMGNLYGTTYGGGIISDSCPAFSGGTPCGTAFELSPSSGGQWAESILHSFQGGTADGYDPESNLILDEKGNLYGNTLEGGESGCTDSSKVGCGTVFELSLSGGSWVEKVLYAFQAHGTGGERPTGGLILDAAGNLYGTNAYGGYNGGGFCGLISTGCGVVFELSLSQGTWTETVIHSFRGSPDGAVPLAGLSMDSSGKLYGTSDFGGNPKYNHGVGGGTAFRLTRGARGKWQEANFEFGADGGAFTPVYPIIPDAAGNVYGVSFGGPPNNSEGVAYQIAVTK